MSEVPFKNPGWAGNVGEYDLTEEQVRGTDFVGIRPLEGGHAAASATYLPACLGSPASKCARPMR